MKFFGELKNFWPAEIPQVRSANTAAKLTRADGEKVEPLSSLAMHSP
jgi:hypothetical protein